MTKTELLEQSILRITKQAGLEMSGRFHLTSVSRDSKGFFIMDVMEPERKRLCEEVQRVVTGFPSGAESSFFALLPEVVDEIIFAARSNQPDFLQHKT
jgi:enamine deaminase RidA (YjgF/YER057c/UK114 family)